MNKNTRSNREGRKVEFFILPYLRENTKKVKNFSGWTTMRGRGVNHLTTKKKLFFLKVKWTEKICTTISSRAGGGGGYPDLSGSTTKRITYVLCVPMFDSVELVATACPW